MGLRCVDLLRIYMDNTTSTNKNLHLTSYGLHLVDSGRFHKVQFYFLPVGHTKFYPDANFASLSNVYRFQDVFQEDVFIYLCGRVAGFVFRMTQTSLFWWRNVLTKRFTSIDGVTKFRVLEFCRDDDGDLTTMGKKTTVDELYAELTGGAISLAGSDFDILENLVSFENADAALASLRPFKDAKYRDLVDVYCRFVGGGHLVECRPPCLRYESAAEAAMDLLHVSRSEAETIVSERGPRRQTRAYYKVGDASKRWSAANVHQMVKESGMETAAETLKNHSVDGQHFLSLNKSTLMAEPFSLDEATAENLCWLKLILKSL